VWLYNEGARYKQIARFIQFMINFSQPNDKPVKQREFRPVDEVNLSAHYV